jgi:hypothetical protein
VMISSSTISFRVAALFLLFSASTLFASMGLGLRTAVWPSMFKRMSVLWVSVMFFIAPMFALWTQREIIGDAPFLLVPIALLAVGAILFRTARRAWLNLELG